MRYRLDVISHSITLDLKMREGLRRGTHYKPEVCVSLQEYGIWLTKNIVLTSSGVVKPGNNDHLKMNEKSGLCRGEHCSEAC